MRAREGVMNTDIFGTKLGDLYPVVEPNLSDSGSVDTVLEFLVMAGRRSLPEAVMTMVNEYIFMLIWVDDPNKLITEIRNDPLFTFHLIMFTPSSILGCGLVQFIHVYLQPNEYIIKQSRMTNLSLYVIYCCPALAFTYGSFYVNI